MPIPPTGTVTFLFTDIEGSTRLLRELGEAYAGALEDHRRLVREAIERHLGHEIDTQGDAFFVAFPRARDAVNAAAEIQRALATHPWPNAQRLRVRMGVHTSEAQATETGYVGLGVHRGARVAAAGHGGQVLLSQTTKDLLEDEGDEALGVRDLGEHRLKDLTEAQRLYQLVGDGLDAEFPPLKTLEDRPTNLPAQATPFVGREREVGEVAERLRRDDVRLVTLTGPGGTGKTRLALQVAAELVDEFPNGVFFVALAPIADPELVLPAIAQAIGISEASGQSLSGYLAPKALLLVTDNLEQVLDAAPPLAELLGQAPKVKVLATSREPLRLAGEHLYPVPPLALPDPKQAPDLAELSQYEAVALFVERAQAADPSFELTSENAPAVAEICARVDGLPLALELAAARIPLLSPEAMVKRLGERLKLLTGGARDLPARQQALRDTLAWSYELLEAGERALFARLGVFVGGFTLEDAKEVAGADLDELASLVDKSLVRRDGERFTMLETIREYALDRLAVSGGEEAAREGHARFFEALAEDAYRERFKRERERSDELEWEHDNLRVALEWLRSTDRERELGLAGALGWFWHVHSHLAEGRARLAEALAGTSSRDERRARALAADGEIAAWQGDVATAKSRNGEAVSIWRELGREDEVGAALVELGWAHFWVGDDASARRYMEESLELHRAQGDPLLVNRSLIGHLQALVSMGEVQTVEELAPEALALAQQLGDLRGEHLAHHYLADCALIRGDCDLAEERYHRSLEAAVELGDRLEICFEVQGLGMAAGGKGRSVRALRLAGAAQAELDSLGSDVSGVRFWNELLERYLTPAREALGAGAEQEWEAGRALGFEDAVELALDRDRDA